MTSGYTLEPFDAASPHFDEVVRVYLEAFGGEENAVRAFIARYANTLPDWYGYVALIGAHVAGMGFGARRLYECYGWRYLHPGLVFTPGQQPFVVMACEINSGV